MKRPLFVLYLILFSMLVPPGSALALPNIGNLVWSDLNNNGSQDAGEPGLTGVTLQLWNSAKNDLITSTTTNASGSYSLLAPSAGSYRVRVLLPQPATQSFSPKNAVADSLDSDINPSGTDLGFTDILTFASGVASVTSVDAGIYTPLPVSIGNLVWSDLNNNGSQDSGEPGLAGVTLQLWNGAKNDLIASTTSIANGTYTLTAPAPGSYRVRVLLPQPGIQSFSPKDAFGVVDSADSDINPSGADLGFTDILTLAAGTTAVVTVDAGIYTPGPVTVGNFIWSDNDADGIQDAGEPGVAGVMVQLWNGAKNDLIASATTAANGTFALTAPEPGSYRVRVLLPVPGLDRFTTKDAAAATDTTDSDINPSGTDLGFTDAFNIAAGASAVTSVDAGLLLDLLPGHTIGNRVFVADAAGLQPADGVTNSIPAKVELLNTAGAVLQTTTAATMSGREGYYGFAAPPGTYRLRFTALQADFIPSPHPNAGGNSSLDSDIDANGYTAQFTVTTAPRRDLDAGFVRIVRVGNLVWHDLDSDGIQDSGEPGVPNVALELWDAAKSRRWDSTTTNSAGNYTLIAPGPGDYRLWVLRPMPGDSFSPANVGSITADSDILSTTADFGFSAAFSFAPTALSNVNFDAGLIFTSGRPVSPFLVTAISRSPARLTFTGPIGGTYQLERGNNLTAWTNVLAPVVTSTQNGSFTLSAGDLLPAENFWRVRRTR